MRYCIINSPVGRLLLAGDGQTLGMVSFQDGTHPTACNPSWVYDAAPFRDAIQQIEAYFAGSLQTFTLKLRPQGTPFQEKVWRQLRAIPYGQTASYGWIAKAIGNPQASRAVGAANGEKPALACHPMPPGDRQQRPAGRVRRGAGDQTKITGSGAAVQPRIIHPLTHKARCQTRLVYRYTLASHGDGDNVNP